MWNDIKKIGSLAFDQTKDQKEILLINLKIKSYSDKKEIAFAELGELLYPMIADGNKAKVNLSDEKVNLAVKEISQIEGEIKSAEEELATLKLGSAEDFNQIASEVGTVWEKTKSAIIGNPEAEEKKSEATADASPAVEPADDKKEKKKRKSKKDD